MLNLPYFAYHCFSNFLCDRQSQKVSIPFRIMWSLYFIIYSIKVLNSMGSGSKLWNNLEFE